eukprot:TRINITY_DN48949_c0_g1_i1.p1 TRINITY_DN48949_c0_g1~~TRINITY_DN48949_c0_g1_i1.p1  ORF type:complete len:409 (-),score=41.81 TRINITY_DN48949_c0_g1_i1:96-1211(-)
MPKAPATQIPAAVVAAQPAIACATISQPTVVMKPSSPTETRGSIAPMLPIAAQRLEPRGSITYGASPLVRLERPRCSSGNSDFDAPMTTRHRRLSFEVPPTPEAYWSRSRAQSAFFHDSEPPQATTMIGGQTISSLHGTTIYASAPSHVSVAAPYPALWENSMFVPVQYPWLGGAPIGMQQYPQGSQNVDSGMIHAPTVLQTASAGVPVASPSSPESQGYSLSQTAVDGSPGSEPVTTLMLRNIPVKYNREMMLEDMDTRGFRGSYDFFYLPIDFQTGNTVGYAFVNFFNPNEASRFRSVYQGRQLSQDSAKICEVGVAKAQGKGKNVEQYRNSSVMGMEERFQPVCFENGIRVPFPPPTRVLKPVKHRRT